MNQPYTAFMDIELKPRIRLFVLDFIKQFTEFERANPQQVIRLSKEYLEYIEKNQHLELGGSELILREHYKYDDETEIELEE